MSEYTCAICHEIYPLKLDSEWNHAKAAEEYLELHPELKNDATEISCDDCFQKYKAWLSTLTDEQKRIMREGA